MSGGNIIHALLSVVVCTVEFIDLKVNTWKKRNDGHSFNNKD